LIPIHDRIPTRRVPVVTIMLVLINVVIFVYEQLLLAGGGDPLLNRFIYTYGLVPARVAGGLGPAVLWTFVTSMFLHASWLHIIGNMLYLWIFGNNIEDVMGPFWFTLFYFLCGFAASFAQVSMSWGSNLPGIGASGAIAGVLAAYLIYFPRARVETLIFLGIFVVIRALPAVILLGFWFILQLISGVTSFGAAETGGVAYFAHIGGFVAGLILALPWLGRARAIGQRYIA
jgi:membrane associated rhomboid family serine protease